MSGSSSYLPYDFAGSWHSTVNPVPPSVTGFTFTPQYHPSIALPPPPPGRAALLAQATAGAAAGASYIAADVANLTRHAIQAIPIPAAPAPVQVQQSGARYSSGGNAPPSVVFSETKTAQPLDVFAAPRAVQSSYVNSLDRIDLASASAGDKISTAAAGWARGDPVLTAKFNEGVERGPTLAAAGLAMAASQGKLGTAAYVGSILGKTASFMAAQNTITVAREGSAFVDAATGRDNPRSYQIADAALRDYSKPFDPVKADQASHHDAVMGPKANVVVAGADLAAKLYRQHGLEKLAGKTDVSWAERVSTAAPMFAEITVDALTTAAAKRFFPTFSYQGLAPARATGQFLQSYLDSAQQGGEAALVTAAQRNLDFARQK
jgi:hypothetical protein